MKKPYKIGDPAFVIKRTATMKNPFLALKEYTANSLDERPRFDLGHAGERITIDVILDREQARIIHMDDGPGMKRDDLYNLPEEYARSKKRHDPSKIGFQQFGLHAYATFAGKCVITTRHVDDTKDSYSRLMLMEDGFLDLEDLPMEDLDYDLRVRHGFIVSMEDLKDKYLIGGKFTPRRVADFLGETFAPLFIREEGFAPTITARYRGRGKDRHDTLVIPPAYYSSELHGIYCKKVMDQRIITPYGTIDMHLWINPQGTNERVALHVQDVLVYGNIGNVEEIMDGICTAKDRERKLINPFLGKVGKFYGYINVWPHMTNKEGYLRFLEGQRETIMEDDRFHDFVEHIRPFVPTLNEILAENAKLIARNRNDMISLTVIKDFRDIYGKKALDELLDTAYENAQMKREGGTRSTQTHAVARRPRPGIPNAPKDDDAATQEQRRNAIPFWPQHEVFIGPEKDLHSKLDLYLSRIFINSGHPDYVRRRENGTDEEKKRYDAEMIVMQVVLLETTRMSEKKSDLTKEQLTRYQTERYCELYNNMLKKYGQR